MKPLEAAITVANSLTDRDKTTLIRHLGRELSACHRTGHKFKPWGRGWSGGLWCLVFRRRLYCEKCGAIREL